MTGTGSYVVQGWGFLHLRFTARSVKQNKAGKAGGDGIVFGGKLGDQICVISGRKLVSLVR